MCMTNSFIFLAGRKYEHKTRQNYKLFSRRSLNSPDNNKCHKVFLQPVFFMSRPSATKRHRIDSMHPPTYSIRSVVLRDTTNGTTNVLHTLLQ